MSNELLPSPRLVLRVGTLGNRQFGTGNGIFDDPARLERAAATKCREALEAVRGLVAKFHAEEQQSVFPAIARPGLFCFTNSFGWVFGHADWWRCKKLAGQRAPAFSDEPPLIQILSGLAPGADQMVVREAQAHAASTGSSTDPVFECLGVVVEEEGWARPTMDGLRESFSVGEIPPRSNTPAGGLVARDEARRRAEVARRRTLGFRAQSEALRHHSDILLAVWDADAEGKAGGTSESVEEALRARLPVLAVRFDEQGQAVLDLLRRVEDLLKPPGQIGRAELETCLRLVLCFPDPPAAQEHDEARHFSSYHPRVAFHRFRTGLPVPVAWPAAWWRKLRAVMERGYEPKASPENQATTSDTPPPKGTFAYHYGAAKDRSSKLSEAFGDAHRGGILWSYLLAAGAVFFALAGIYLHHLHAPAGLLVAVAGAELLTIAALWALAETAKFEDWHEAYTDLRILAEAARHMKYLGPLGVHAPMPKLPPHLAGTSGPASGPAPTHDPRRIWSVWYFRALVRAAPLQLITPPVPSPDQLRKTLLEKWIGNPDPQATPARRGSQTEYHRRNRRVQSGLLHRLETLADYGFVIVFAAALVHVADALHGFRHSSGHAPGEEAGVGILFTICFWLGVGGPALLAAITGFLSQIEAMRMRQRSVGMTLLLAERHRVLSALDLTTAPAAVEARWRLAAEAAITAGLMVDETAGWALIYKSADIHAG